MGDDEELDLESLIETISPLLGTLFSAVEDAKRDADAFCREQWPTTGDGYSYSHLVRANVNEILSSVVEEYGATLVPTQNTGIHIQVEGFRLRVLHDPELDKDYVPKTAARAGYINSSRHLAPQVDASPVQGQLDLASAGMQSVAGGAVDALGLDSEAVAYATQCQTDGRVHGIVRWAYVSGEQKMVLSVPLFASDTSDEIDWWRIDVGDLLGGRADFESFGSILPDGVSDSEFFKMPTESKNSGELGSNERREA